MKLPAALADNGDRLGYLIIEIFRLNGRLLAAGDELMAPLGLTSARWQVLGAIGIAPVPQPVAHLARTMGLNRQGVQRIVNELEAEGLVAFTDNPNHRRARLVEFTDKGRTVFAQAEAQRRPWVAALAENLPAGDIETALALVKTLRHRLQQAGGDENS